MRKAFAFGIGIAIFFLGSSQVVLAQAACSQTTDACNVAADATSSHIQIGGAGSLSSNETCGAFPCDAPGRLDGGTIAEAVLDFSLVRSSGMLTIELRNTTATVASLTAIYFNAPSGVTGISLVGGSLSKTCPPSASPCPVLASWHTVFDPAAPRQDGIRADGFGRFDAYVGNSTNTSSGGGNPIELLAGETLTLDLALAGDLSGVTACSFTSEGSKIPPGEHVVLGVGRFQAGGMGDDSGWLGPCNKDGLFVDLRWFEADPQDGEVTLRWATALELDNAGFNILRKSELGGPWSLVNTNLIPAVGDTFVGETYDFTDTAVTNGERYIYRLEDIDIHGFNKLHEPTMTVPNPRNPRIKLQHPAYGASVAVHEAIALRWRTASSRPLRVQISADPTFPEGARAEFPVRSGRRIFGETEITLNDREKELVASLAAASEFGQVYWRVIEVVRRNGTGQHSDVSRFGVQE